MKNKQIVFTKINTAELLDIEYQAPKPHEVVVETAISAISCGTEKANITGDPHISIYSKDDEPVVFPRAAGYSSSGVVVEVGENVKNVKVGDRVAMAFSFHKKYNTIRGQHAFKLDDNVSFEHAAVCYIGTFPMAALRKTRLEVGESMMVMGLGILGLLAVQFAHAAGAVPVIAVDPIKERREKALKFGADYALDPFDPDFVNKVKELSGGGVNTAIEVTGLGVGLEQCLDCMKKFGRVALLGCTRDKNFTIDYYRKVHGPGISIIGAHTMARPFYESSENMFTLEDDMGTILKLLSLGRISFDGLVDEIHSPKDCYEVFDRLVHDKNFPVVAEFDWRLA